jgi:hypothetical protein
MRGKCTTTFPARGSSRLIAICPGVGCRDDDLLADGDAVGVDARSGSCCRSTVSDGDGSGAA